MSAFMMPCPNDDESRVKSRCKKSTPLGRDTREHISKHTSLHHDNTTDHYAIERICSAQNVLFKTVLRAVRVAAFKSPNRSVKF